MSKKKSGKNNSKKKKGGKSNCSNVFLDKKSRRELFKDLDSVDWCDEDSVWDIAVELGRLSVQLRSEVLNRSNDVE